jgi:3-oxoacyl-[acyl-carrier-protein] synthase II
MQLWRETEPVVITGIGLITALGTGAEKSWAAMKEGRSGIRRITYFDPTPFPSQIAGEVHDFEPEAFIDPREVRKMDRYVQFAAAATFMALQDAELSGHTAQRRAGWRLHRVGHRRGVDLGGKSH